MGHPEPEANGDGRCVEERTEFGTLQAPPSPPPSGSCGPATFPAVLWLYEPELWPPRVVLPRFSSG